MGDEILLHPAAAPQAAQELIDLVGEISLAGEQVKLYRRDCSQLLRRLKLIIPLLEELRELRSIPDNAGDAVRGLAAACRKAKQLVSLCQAGPKLYLVLAKDSVGRKFLEIAQDLAGALDVLPLGKLEVSDEVVEQVELVHSQLKRAKLSANAFEGRLLEELLGLLSRGFSDEEIDQGALRRLAESLQLKTSSDLRKESLAFLKVKGEVEGDDKVENLLRLLRAVVAQDDKSTAASGEMTRLSPGAVDKSGSVPVVPDEFRCPISLDLMKDPVIVATGQTYDRVSIQKWLDAGRKTCPKTQQVLPHLVLTPNYVLRSLIAQWCETHGVDPPKGVGAGRRGSKQSSCSDLSPAERASIEILVKKLSSPSQPDAQRAAAGELRLLAKKSSENRVCIAEAGAIPFLVNLLATKEQKTQEHAVTALLNLSINDNNKGPIVMLGAIDPIVEVLKSGSMEARENAAATLFSLSVVDENKVSIGASDAIPALVELLREGSPRGKKDALTALFNLSIYQGNKPRAVRAGVVPLLMDLLVDQGMGMVDESLAILAILATHQEGRVMIGKEGAVPLLVELITMGSPRNKENAAAVLHALSSTDSAHLVAAEQLGVEEALVDLAQNGSARARRKANSLLDNLKLHRQQQQLVNSSDCCS